MAFIDIAHRIAQKIGFIEPPGISRFEALNGGAATVADESAKGLPRLFFDRRGREVWKWRHYLDVYDRHFAPWRSRPVRFLEIGVLHGGSLELWRDYFGRSATIYGIDIDPACAGRVSPPNHVRIGSQADEAFLASVVDEMGGVDIVIDDGSHIARHQHAAFRALFPRLSEGGLYAIEDMHTAYWGGHYEGGYRRAGTAIDLVRQLIDDQHHWYHGRGIRAACDVGEVVVNDSLAIISKRAAKAPTHLRMPHVA